jgi:uncharacterized membrane protein (UPF0136 family)
MVVKLFDSLVHGCYSGSYFVSAAYIVEKGKQTCYLGSCFAYLAGALTGK